MTLEPDPPLAAALRAHYARDRATLDAQVAAVLRLGAAGLPTETAEDRAIRAAYIASRPRWDAPPRLRALRRFAPRLAAAAALALAALFASRLIATDPLRIKGDGEARLIVMASRGDGEAFVVAPDTRLATGDRLGFFVTADAPGAVAVYLVDAEQAVRLAPTRDRRGTYRAGALRPLPEGAELTAGDRCEWLVAAFSPAPLPLERLDAALAPHATDPCLAPTLDAIDRVEWQVTRIRR